MRPIFRSLTIAFVLGCSAVVAGPASAQAKGPVIDAAPEPVLAPVTLPAIVAPIDHSTEAASNAPLWFRDAASREAAKLLPAILRRGQIEGLFNAVELAGNVEEAIGRAEAGSAALATEERILSSAWVKYVRALHGAQPDMSFGDPALVPRAPLPGRILQDALEAKSLAAHVRAVSAVNPVYAKLREQAWSKVRPDPQLQLVSASTVEEPVLTNLRRARLLPATGRFLVVNLATARLWMDEDGRATDSMKVIVGKADTPTPMLAGTIHYATFHPYWNIPTDVTRRVVAPLVLKRGVAYLKAARYEVASGWTDEATLVDPETIDWKAVADGTVRVRVRQLPGDANMMGAIKFGFANDRGIYLHDTPAKALFGRANRAYSLGCVRLEDAQRLARWMFGNALPPGSDEPEQHVKLASPVPIYLTHLTLPDEVPADGAQLTSAAIADPLGALSSASR